MGVVGDACHTLGTFCVIYVGVVHRSALWGALPLLPTVENARGGRKL